MRRLEIMFGDIVSFLRSARSASRVCAALEAGRTPAASDLRRLGISPEGFGAIRR